MNLIDRRINSFLTQNEQLQKILIWGSGQIGWQIRDVIQNDFPQRKFLGFIDSGVQKEIKKDGCEIYPTTSLESFEFDVLIIASIAYEMEILRTIQSEFPSSEEKVYLISENLEILHKINQYKDANNIKALQDLAFDYPDCAAIWNSLARLETNEGLRRTYQQCADRLAAEEG